MKLLGVKMAEETKKGHYRECEIAGVRYLVWSPPPGSVEEGQPFPFCAFPADDVEAAKKKWPFVPTETDETKESVFYHTGNGFYHTGNGEFSFSLDHEDDIWRKDYEAARRFAWHNHALLSMCKKYEEMLAVCGGRLLEPEAKALEALDKLRDNLRALADLKIKKLPHLDVVFIPQPKPYGDV